VFGNEDTADWKKFCKFAKCVHPTFDTSTDITVMTDMDKKCNMGAVKTILPNAGSLAGRENAKININD
jgi:hypothetical protein